MGWIPVSDSGCFLFVGSFGDCIDFIAEKRQREGSFAKVSPIGAERCVKLCKQLDTCFAVNYFLLNATCQFLNQTMPESKLMKAAKCFYKSVRGPTKESIDMDPCHQKLCLWDEICVQNRTSNLAECYPFCKPLPEKSWTINETIEADVGQTYTYRCLDGLTLKSGQNPTVTCLHDGSWTSTNVTCVCSNPPKRSWTINETAEVEVGQNYTYKCQEGLTGKRGQNPTVKCLQDGSWSPTNFTCVCKTPPDKPWTIMDKAEIVVGQNYTYRCQDGAFDKGGFNPTVTCQHDGNWTSSDLVCAPSATCDMNYTTVTLDDSYGCVKFHSSKATFNDAMKICESEKAKLLVITNQTQISVLRNINQGVCTYIGLWDGTIEGLWMDWKGEELYPFWSPGQPDGGINQNCGVICGGIGVDSIECNYLGPFVCHKRDVNSTTSNSAGIRLFPQYYLHFVFSFILVTFK